MTHHETRLKAAYRHSRLSFLGISFQRALAIKPIRIALECAVKAEAKGKPAPSQPALI
ncbi:MAG: hypothetical protein ABFC42_10315 [Sulfuricella sp.]